VPVELIVVVSHFEPTRPVDVDLIDLFVFSVPALVGELLAAGRVRRTVVVPAVVGDFGLVPPAGVNGSYLGVVSVEA
jgi:hypothetical protein